MRGHTICIYGEMIEKSLNYDQAQFLNGVELVFFFFFIPVAVQSIMQAPKKMQNPRKWQKILAKEDRCLLETFIQITVQAWQE